MSHRANMPKHERAMINVLLMNIENTKLGDAKNLFESLDVDHAGFVSFKSLSDGMLERRLPARTAQDLFAAAGVTPDQNLEFDDFVLACFDAKTLTDQELHSILLSTFLRMDEDHVGYLTRTNLRYVFPEAILEDLFAALAPKTPDQIDFDDFRNFFGNMMEREWASFNDTKSAAFRDFMVAGSYNGFKGELKNRTRRALENLAGRKNSGSNTPLKNSETEDEDSEMLFPKGGRWQKVRKDSAASEASGDYGPSGSVNYRTGGSVTYSEDSRSVRRSSLASGPVDADNNPLPPAMATRQSVTSSGYTGRTRGTQRSSASGGRRRPSDASRRGSKKTGLGGLFAGL
jgi:Ca2+-binding EF-hand superfamily protein